MLSGAGFLRAIHNQVRCVKYVWEVEMEQKGYMEDRFVRVLVEDGIVRTSEARFEP